MSPSRISPAGMVCSAISRSATTAGLSLSCSMVIAATLLSARARCAARSTRSNLFLGNLVDAVFDCYARHAVLPVLCKACCNDTLPLRSLLRRDDVGLVFSARGGCARFLGRPAAAPAAPRLRLGHDTESTP